MINLLLEAKENFYMKKERKQTRKTVSKLQSLQKKIQIILVKVKSFEWDIERCIIKLQII